MKDDLVQQLMEIESDIAAVVKQSKADHSNFDKWSGGCDEGNRIKYTEQVNLKLRQLRSKRNVLRRLIDSIDEE